MENEFRQLLINTMVSYGLPEESAKLCAKDFYTKLLAQSDITNRLDGFNLIEQLEQLDAYYAVTNDPYTAFENTKGMEDITDLLLHFRSSPDNYNLSLKYCKDYSSLPMSKDGRVYASEEYSLDYFWKHQGKAVLRLRRDLVRYVKMVEQLQRLEEPKRTELLLDTRYCLLPGIPVMQPNDFRTVREALDDCSIVVRVYPALSLYGVPTLESMCQNTLANASKAELEMLEYKTRTYALLKEFMKLSD